MRGHAGKHRVSRARQIAARCQQCCCQAGCSPCLNASQALFMRSRCLGVKLS